MKVRVPCSYTMVMESGDYLNNVFYSGIDFQLPGNGGQDCVNFLSNRRRIIESILALAVSCLLISFGYRRLIFPTKTTIIRKDRGGKRFLLVVLCLVFGVEIGFKFATRSLIFILNPCHVTTMIQIYLLAAPPSQQVTKIFRIHVNFLNGAILALLFPVINTRLLTFETETYFVQHIAMLVVPYYLLRLGGVYTLEDAGDFSWASLSYGLMLFYHFTLLQIVGMLTTVNLNSMICPAVSDPFYGQHYRVAALVHQFIMVPLVSKAYRIVASYFLTRLSFTKVKDKLEQAIETDLAFGAYRTSSISCVSNSNFHPLAINGDKCSKKE
ncbi:transmembrane protein 164 [Daphnia magna]|uniref:Transmembrane protein n=2 Tax=Daphnia magna TaxID=35525 RepID=A0A0P5PC18_9CRUS|nr:transmembrane protein 164 [Daphnia magna]KAK4027720.1 hypothetical protein OUZ56_016768 [Daphnia magna]KZS21129.1 Transmembrane protein 164 [Daphnia magna]